jgi:hypothetical protein
MALIKCSECNKEVSTNAHAKQDPLKVEPVLVSKKWKRRSLISLGVTLLGGAMFVFAMPFGFSDETGFAAMIFSFGFLIGLGGFIVLIVCRVAAYYNDRRMN